MRHSPADAALAVELVARLRANGATAARARGLYFRVAAIDAHVGGGGRRGECRLTDIAHESARRH